MKYPETIIIERMYAGKYIDDNIGHEIINTFKTDNDENYIYITVLTAQLIPIIRILSMYYWFV